VHFCSLCGNDVSGVRASLATEQVAAPTESGPRGGPENAQAEQFEHLRDATLGEYEVLGELGRGGMATVYLAHEIALERKVAIKVMSPSLVSGEGMVERFKREARTSASLSHPNIIPVYAVRETDRILYFVMKFVQGRPLDSIIKDVGPLPIPMIKQILSQVGGAFGYAHRRGIIHRDIKPANIMIDDEGWAVVTDFGIAKVSESQGLTMTGMTVGTPTYMSPEQCMAQDVTGASDQYSLGVVAYEMITGRPPFAGASMMAIMYGHFNDPPPPIEGPRPDCPGDLKAAVMRMLEKDPAKRWPTVEDAIQAMGPPPAADDPTRNELVTLARKGANRPSLIAMLSTPQSPIPRTRPNTPRPTNKPFAGRKATATSAPPPTQASPPPSRPPVVASSPPAKSSRGLLIGGGVAVVVIAGLLAALAPWKKPAAVREPPAPAEATTAQQPGPTAAQAETPAPSASAPQSQPEPTPPAPVPQAQPPKQSAPPSKPAAQPPASKKDDAQVKREEAQAAKDKLLYDDLKAKAGDARAKAVAAGATGAELQAGDLLRSSAETMAGQGGRYGEAIKPIGDAGVEYARALGAAQGRATAAAAAQARQAAAPPPAATAPAPAPANDRPLVEFAITTFARSMAAGDIDEMLKVYPGLSREAQEGIKTVTAQGNSMDTSHWKIVDISVTGNTASARIGGNTVLVDKKGKRTSVPPPSSFSLERSGGGWRITAMNN